MTEEISTRQPTYSIGEFEGPLDLLLFLIRKNEVNIYDIPIADITKQYLDYLATAESDLDDMTEFCVMASTLLYIKSCLLLPEGIDVDDDTEDPRTELVERLIEYQKHKSLGQLIASKQAEADWLPARREREIELLHPEKEMWEEVAVWDLLKAFSTLVSSISMERIIDLHEEMTVNEKMALVLELLETKGKFEISAIITRGGSVLEIICAFMAILELAKQQIIRLYQHKLYGHIRIVGIEAPKTHATEQ